MTQQMLTKMNTPGIYEEELNLAQSFAVVLVCPTGYIHSLALLEIAETIYFALLNLGLDAILTDAYESPGRKNIILGGHLLKNAPDYFIPDDAIIYNFEQIVHDSSWIDDYYLHILRTHTVWDYSLNNINSLKLLGISDISYLPLGHVDQLSRIPTTLTKDIDILFYGSINSRREFILNNLKLLDLNVVSLFGVYGKERDNYIARSKIVVNIHFYESKIFEVARISYLLSNSVCVITETGLDPIENEYSNAVIFTEYNEMVSKCFELVHNPKECAKWRINGKEFMQKKLQENFLKGLL